MSYKLTGENILFYTSFSIRNLWWILMRFYFPLPDFFALGTKKIVPLRFSRTFSKNVFFPKLSSDMQVIQTSHARLASEYCVWKSRFSHCLRMRAYSLDRLPSRRQNKGQDCRRREHSSLSPWCWVVFVLLNQHSTASWFCDCLLLIVLACFGAGNRRFWPQKFWRVPVRWRLRHDETAKKFIRLVSSVTWILMTRNLHMVNV